MAPTSRMSTSSRLIPITELAAHPNPSEFAAFGQVIQNPATHNGQPKLERAVANQGSATKWLDITHMTNYYHLSRSRKAARVVMNMFVCQPRKLRQRDDGKMVFPVEILERHPFTPQTFVPIGLSGDDKNTCYLVIVAPTLPLRSGHHKDALQPPPYPLPPPRRRRSLKDRLLRGRPEPFTNEFAASTNPAGVGDTSAPKPKGPGGPDLANIKAFIVRGDQAVTYGPGTWHAPMVVLGAKPVDFVVVQYANGVDIEDVQECAVEADDAGDGVAVDLSGIEVVTALKAKL